MVDIQFISPITKPIEVLAQVECVAGGTGAGIATGRVDTGVGTSTLLNQTFINIYKYNKILVSSCHRNHLYISYLVG